MSRGLLFRNSGTHYPGQIPLVHLRSSGSAVRTNNKSEQENKSVEIRKLKKRID